MALTDNLVSYWKLDEASGNRADAHGSNTLTDQNTVGSATGKINNAGDFERDNAEYLTHGDNSDLSTGDIDFTISCWVNIESLVNSGLSTIVAKGTAGFDAEYYLGIVDGLGFIFSAFRSPGTQTIIYVGSNPSNGTWYHVVARHDATNNLIKLTINNSPVSDVSFSGGCNDSTYDFAIGALSNGASLWDGLIDEVGFWKRCLTDQEITDLYNSGNGLAYPFTTESSSVSPSVSPSASQSPSSSTSPSASVSPSPSPSSSTSPSISPSASVSPSSSASPSPSPSSSASPSVAPGWPQLYKPYWRWRIKSHLTR